MQAVGHLCGVEKQTSSEVKSHRKDPRMEDSILNKDRKKAMQCRDINTDTAKAIEDLRANVMEMTKVFRETMEATRPQFNTIQRVSKAFSISENKARTMLNLLKTVNSNVAVGTVRVGKQKIQLGAGQITTVIAQAHFLKF